MIVCDDVRFTIDSLLEDEEVDLLESEGQSAKLTIGSISIDSLYDDDLELIVFKINCYLNAKHMKQRVAREPVKAH